MNGGFFSRLLVVNQQATIRARPRASQWRSGHYLNASVVPLCISPKVDDFVNSTTWTVSFSSQPESDWIRLEVGGLLSWMRCQFVETELVSVGGIWLRFFIFRLSTPLPLESSRPSILVAHGLPLPDENGQCVV